MSEPVRYATETITVAVPCPKCGADNLERTYIPALGSMNGEVKCAACDFTDSYVATLASAMPGDDPLPSELVSRPLAPRPTLVEFEEAKPRAIMLPTPVANFAAILSLLFGALARAVTPDRRIRLSQRTRPLARGRRIHRRLASVVGRP